MERGADRRRETVTRPELLVEEAAHRVDMKGTKDRESGQDGSEQVVDGEQRCSGRSI